MVRGAAGQAQQQVRAETVHEECVFVGAVTRLNWVRPRFGGALPTMRVCRISRPDVDVLFGEDARTDQGRMTGWCRGALSINETESLIAPARSIDVARHAGGLNPSSQNPCAVCACKGVFRSRREMTLD